MKRLFQSLSAASLFIAAVVFSLAGAGSFAVVHPLVLDGLGDALERLGDGPSPGWGRAFFSDRWFLFYLPSAVLFVVEVWLAALGSSMAWHHPTSSSQ
jgi:hypothetical protein